MAVSSTGRAKNFEYSNLKREVVGQGGERDTGRERRGTRVVCK